MTRAGSSGVTGAGRPDGAVAPDAAATALERRYRRLLWLLPPAQRRVRGEELVGVLTDVDAGRSWPSPAEAWAVLLLALRLRAAGSRPVLVLALTVLLVAESTRGAGYLIDIYFGDAYARFAAAFRDAVLTQAPFVGLGLLAAVAWIVGAVRVATIAYGIGYLVSGGLLGQMVLANGRQIPAFMLVAMVLPTTIMVLLVAAWRRRWAPPRPPVLWLLLLVACVAGWKGVAVLSRPGHPHTELYDVLATVGVVLVCTVVVAWVVRHRRWPVVAAAGLAGAAVGYLLASRSEVATWFWFAPHNGNPLPFAIGLLVVAATVHLLMRPHAEQRE